MAADLKQLEKLAKLVRYFILVSSTEAGSGHPTSSLSATDLTTALFFGGFLKYDLKNPENKNNDRVIFSKGHASPLFYSLYAAAGDIDENELKTMRKFGSRLEGHPTMKFPHTVAATGSLGQGLSVGVGIALNNKNLEKNDAKVYVLMGDSEAAEGSVWEAAEIASYYKLNNLVAILDVNRLGQRGETMYGHRTEVYEDRFKAFGWETYVVDGHDITEIVKILKQVQDDKTEAPKIIIAKTLKGKGVFFIEDKDGWHGKALKPEEMEKALKELGEVDKSLRGEIEKPGIMKNEEGIMQEKHNSSFTIQTSYKKNELVATRKAYGNVLVKLVEQNPDVVVLDAETSNSTMAESVKKTHPEKFFEMFIAEQNMVGTALGFSRAGKIPFVSTFSAFFSRAFDQIRMSQYSDGNIKFVGSHCGVSIGEDGASQMGLEDIAMFRTLLDSVVFYPSDAVSTEKLVKVAAECKGNVYIRTTRADTPVLYSNDEDFKIGGSKTHRIKNLESGIKDSKIVVIGAGITLHEALDAQKKLGEEGTGITVVDLYSIKPVDQETLTGLAKEAKAFITIEDHFPEGGIGEAVRSALAETDIKIHSLAVRKMPMSGKPEELLSYEEIDSEAIIDLVNKILKIH